MIQTFLMCVVLSAGDGGTARTNAAAAKDEVKEPEPLTSVWEPGTALDGGAVSYHLKISLKGPALLGVTPAQLPPSKTRILFDRAPIPRIRDALKSASAAEVAQRLELPGEPAVAAERAQQLSEAELEHFEVSWDPAESRALTKSVRLGTGVWQVSMVSIPIEYERKPFSNAAWSLLCSPKEENRELFVSRTGEASISDVGAIAYYQTSEVAIGSGQCAGLKSGWRGVALRFEELVQHRPDALLATFGEKGEAVTPIGSVPRSFGVDVEKIAGEAFQAVADVAVVRAQQAALDAAKRLIVSQLCDDWASDVRRVLRGKYSIDQEVFPRTCQVLRNINAAGITTVGRTLQRSLVGDAVEVGSNLVTKYLGSCLSAPDQCVGFEPVPGAQYLGPALGTLAGVVASAVFESDSTLPRAQAFVVEVVRSQRDDAKSRELFLSMSVLAYCHQAGGCDSHAIRTFLQNPDTVVQGLSPVDRRLMGDAVALVSHGLTIMAPKKGDDTKVYVLNALRFGRGTVKLLAEGADCKPDSRCRATVAAIDNGIDMLFAAAEGEPVRLVVMAGALLAKAMNLEATPGGVKVLAALATYADTYSNPENATPEQLRQRRADAINSLADLAKERELREGSWSIAFGTWIGPRGNLEWTWQPSQPFAGGLSLSIPLGLMVQRHFSKDLSLWLAPSVVDVGAYTHVSFGKTAAFDPSPISALSFGGAFGVGVFEDWAVALDARVQPWAFQTAEALTAPAMPGAVAPNRVRISIGLSVVYTIPLLWLR